MDAKDVLITFPELLLWFPLISGLIAFFLKKGNSAKNWALVSSFITLAIGITSLFFLDNKYFNLNNVSYYWMPSIGSSFALKYDGMARLLCLLNAIAFPLVFLSTYRQNYKNSNRFYGLMLLTQAGLAGVFCAMDALIFYFFWELALIPVYFLSSIWGGERRIQATFKFFIYTFAGSLLLLAGIIYVYLHTPEQSFSLNSFMQANLPGAAGKFAFWLFFIAFAIKMPVFPFHTWQPDAYEQSPTGVTMILSGVMVKMGLYAVIRWLIPVFPAATAGFANLIIWLSVIGMIYASFLAWKQDDLKRLVAYSSIAHIGLMCAAIFVINESGLDGVMVQMFNHGVNVIALWIVIELIERNFGTRKISELGGLATIAPALTVFLVIAALANIALPLTNAFIGEFLMFSALFQHGKFVTAFALISIIFAAVYTLNMIQKVFYGELNSGISATPVLGKGAVTALAVIVIIIFVAGVYPKPMIQLAQDSVNLFFNRLKGL
ncbi:MAG: NADH-quinone oxidoreductase subunit M [Chitinophagaceae bacterium]|nr:NADH-quinone oxidoreductase subunit M [Chitinophagaceae bacterium]MCW5927880.1 NADH-quinone oxidoreductase subunit M [Chitinophagaceae bacterium]